MKKPASPKQKLRTRLIRETMDEVKAGADSQGIVHSILNDDEFAAAYDVQPERENPHGEAVAEGIVRFCEHACGFSR